MNKNPVVKNSLIFIDTKLTSYDFEKSDPIVGKKIAFGPSQKNSDVTDEGKKKPVQNFIQNIQSFSKKNGVETEEEKQWDWKKTYQHGLNKRNEKKVHFSEDTNQLSQSVSQEQTGNSALKYMAENKLRPNEINKITTSLRNDGNPFVFSPKRGSQKRVKIFAEVQNGKQLNQRVSGKAEKIQEKQVDSSKAFIVRQEEGPVSTSELSSKQSGIMFKLPSPAPLSEKEKKMSEGSDSFDFNLPPPVYGVKKESLQADSEDDSSNLYDKAQISKSKAKVVRAKGNSNQKQGFSMMPLERILEASNLYRDYLKRGHSSRMPSICLTEVDLVEKQKLPQQFFFKAERVIFNKVKEDQSHDYNYIGHHKICKVNEDRTKFYFQDLKLEQIKNMKGLKCSQINLQKELKMSQNVQYDHQHKRFYLYSNKEQKILVYSQASQQVLCQIISKKRVYDPHLFLHRINNRCFLMLIGGYTKAQKNVVQGSKTIEIFQLKKWQIELKSHIIVLSIGRISPIILSISQKHQNRILILGGNTIARKDSKDNLDFDFQQETNQSTNLTGTSIPSQEIAQLFDYNQQAITFLHPLRIPHPRLLHDGCVVAIKNTHLLLLPRSKRLMQVKFMSKQINLTEGKFYEYLPMLRRLQRKQLCLHLEADGIVMYRISQKGNFQIISHEDKNQRTCSCFIY